MRIPSDIKYIRKVSAEIENFLRSKNIDESYIFYIRLCAEEAIKNSILHGNKGDKGKSVFITYSLKGDKFNMEIEDEGSGFDPLKLPDPTKNENLLMEGGRGVFLIQKLMDKVEYNDRKNKVSMIKFIKEKKGGRDAN
ncbi:MAG: ATP-binding protein [Candidatus Omnitrophica bacterium]|nr:ATP-binding protein [Candidatus Omnitrophota bacterium]